MKNPRITFVVTLCFFLLLLVQVGCVKDFPPGLLIDKAGKDHGAAFGVIDGIAHTEKGFVTFITPDKRGIYKIKLGPEGLFIINKKPGQYKLKEYSYVDKSGTVVVTLATPLPIELKAEKVTYVGRVFSSPLSANVYLLDEYVRDIELFRKTFKGDFNISSSFPNQKYYNLMNAAKGPRLANVPRSTKDYVNIPATTYLMGDVRSGFECMLDGTENVSEIPPHQVHLDKFEIEASPVTMAEFSAFARKHLPPGALSRCISGKSRYSGGHPMPNWDNKPATCVSWRQAQEYCTSLDMRLPTEAEWELAARGKAWGDRNYGGIENTSPSPGQNAGNRNVDGDGWWISPYGLALDGNALGEWVYDRYHPRYYQDSPINNPTGHTDGSKHIVRAGPFRFNFSSTYSSTRIGFRCVKSSGALAPYSHSVVPADDPEPAVDKIDHDDESIGIGNLPRLVVRKKSKIYMKPTIAAQIVAEVKRGDILGTYGLESGWYKVVTENGKEGYIFEDFVSPIRFGR